MGAHVFVVNNETFPIMRDNGLVAVFKEDKTATLHKKTKADILADLSCLRMNDRIFFYEIGVGFHGVYEVASYPFIDDTILKSNSFKLTDAPYRALIRPKYYFKNPVPEKRVFGLKNSANDFRSLFYKKALGRGKANTHIFPEEENNLFELLNKSNNGISEISINPYKPKNDLKVFFDLSTNETGELLYEKILEGWLTQNIDKLDNNCHKFLGKIQDIECFANYVPVNIAGGNIDLIVYHNNNFPSINSRYKISIIELKKGIVDRNSIIEVEEYIKWAYENISSNDIEIIQPIVIGKKINDSAIKRAKEYGINKRNPILVEYNVDASHYFIDFEIINY